MNSPMVEIDKDILDGFREESRQLLKELGAVVTGLEGASELMFPAALLEEFSQKIDRIMGAAKTLLMAAPDHAGLQIIGKISEICKAMGYKASEKKTVTLIPLFAAFWGDVLEVLEELLEALEDRDETLDVAKSFAPVLQRRLEWLMQRVDPEKYAAMKTGSNQVKLVEGQITADEFTSLLKDLGVG